MSKLRSDVSEKNVGTWKKDCNESWLPDWKGSWQQESSRSLTLVGIEVWL